MHEAVELAEEGSEDPALAQVVHQVDPGAGQRHHEVAHCQVHEVVVGGGLHALVARHHHDHGDVAQDSDGHDENVDCDLRGHFPRGHRPVEKTEKEKHMMIEQVQGVLRTLKTV